MKYMTTKQISFVFLFAALLTVIAGNAQAVPILSIEPSDDKVHTGEQLDVDIRISGLGDGVAPSLGAFDLRFIFNPLLLNFTSLSFGDPALGNQLDLFGLGSINGFAQDSIGLVDFFEVSLDSALELDTLQADSFILATLSFTPTPLSSGFTNLNLAIPDLADSLGNAMSATVNSASVQVSEPSTIILFIINLVALGFVLKRRNLMHSPILSNRAYDG